MDGWGAAGPDMWWSGADGCPGLQARSQLASYLWFRPLPPRRAVYVLALPPRVAGHPAPVPTHPGPGWSPGYRIKVPYINVNRLRPNARLQTFENMRISDRVSQTLPSCAHLRVRCARRAFLPGIKGSLAARCRKELLVHSASCSRVLLSGLPSRRA